MREEAKRRRGSSRGLVRILPRLARWAGVGVFVLAALSSNCENGEGLSEIEDDGFIWVGSTQTSYDLLKVGNNTGTILLNLPLGGEPRQCFGMLTGRLTGNIYILSSNILEKYDARGEKVFSVSTGFTEEKFALDESRNALWTAGMNYLKKRSPYDGEPVNLTGHGLVKVASIDVDRTDGGLWLGGKTSRYNEYSVSKYSTAVEKIRSIRINANPDLIAINPLNGDLWIASVESRTGGCERLLSKYSGKGLKSFDINISSPITNLAINTSNEGCFALYNDKVEEYSPNGELVWAWPFDEPLSFIPSYRGEVLFVTEKSSGWGRKIIKIDVANNRVLWSTRVEQTEAEYLSYCSK